MRVITGVLSVLLFSVLVGTAVKGYREPSVRSTSAAVQDTVYLDRRISMLETRLSSIESSIRSLEQQTMNSQRSLPSQPSRDSETVLLRSEVEILNARMSLLECGLVQLDERTLSASAKETRKRTSAQPLDPCRLNPEAPIPLTPRR
jgi:predicted  nucleic acid-binding Zn-ribbon protein